MKNNCNVNLNYEINEKWKKKCVFIPSLILTFRQKEIKRELNTKASKKKKCFLKARIKKKLCFLKARIRKIMLFESLYKKKKCF